MYEEYTTENRGDLELIHKARVKRARIQAIVFGVITGFMLIILVYSYVQNEKHEEEKIKWMQTIQKLEDENRKCAEAAFRQMKDAQQAAKSAELEIQRLRSKH